MSDDTKKKTEVNEAEGGAVMYHRVYENESFEDAAQALFKILRTAQKSLPGKKRILFLHIDGHRNSAGGFDRDMLELQKEFLMGHLMPFLSEASVPLMQGKRIVNTKPQRNDVPEELRIRPASADAN
jgi:hypothetical protein